MGSYPLADGGTRLRWELPAQTVSLDASETDDGFELNISTDGAYDRVPMFVERCLVAGVTLENVILRFSQSIGDTICRQDGHVNYNIGLQKVILIDGAAEHALASSFTQPQPV